VPAVAATFRSAAIAFAYAVALCSARLLGGHLGVFVAVDLASSGSLLSCLVFLLRIPSVFPSETYSIVIRVTITMAFFSPRPPGMASTLFDN